MRAIFALIAAAASTATAMDRRVHHQERFPGIDLVVYTTGRGVEYDWIVHPGADPSAIRMNFRDAAIDSNGDLVVTTPAGLVRHTRPHTYQEVGASRRVIPSEFVVEAGGVVSFHIGAYDPALTLVIDPQVEWVAAFGNSYSFDEATLHPRLGDAISDMAIDKDGNVWVTGMAYFSGFPKVKPIQSECPSEHCTFVTKLSPDGTKILFSSYIAAPVQLLGWPLLNQYTYFPSAIACDQEGNVYITGTSDAAKLPLIEGRQAQSRGGNDVFLLKLDANGTVKARLVFGGSDDDVGTSLALGYDGFLYIAGETSSPDFPASPGGYRADRAVAPNLFAVKIDPKLVAGDAGFTRAAVYSALPGVSLGDPVISADASGNAYVGVYTYCHNPGPIQPATCGTEWYDTVPGIFKLNATGTALIWASNPFGSSQTDLSRMAVSPAGDVYVAGNTRSSAFPVTKGAFRTTPYAGGATGYVAKLQAGGNVIEWATYVAGGSAESNGRPVRALAIDATGSVYVGGYTATPEIAELNAVQSKATLSASGFLTAFKPNGSSLVWSTPLGTYGPSLIALGPAAVYAAGTVNPGKTIANISDTGAPFGSQTISIAKINPAGTPVFQPGIPLAGGLASMFVDAPVQPAGLSILVGGAPAFIADVVDKQINFQVPYEGYGAAAPGNRYAVELQYAGLSSFALLSASGPGIFTLPDGSAAVEHGSDYSLVTRSEPASPGEVVIVYVTGLGYAGLQRTGVPPSGPAQARGCYPLTTNAGDVLYAGVTPGVAGLYQMNVRLRGDLPSGDFRLVVTRNDCPPPPLTPVYLPAGPIKRESNTVILPVR